MMKRTGLLAATLGLAAMFFFPSGVRAQFLVVDCSGANPFAFPTINSALPNAGLGAFIQVTGTCNENVFIYGANNLVLGAPFGQTATLNGNLTIQNSQLVFLYGLNVTNQFGDGVDINSSRSVVLDSCSSSGNTGTGLVAEQTSDVSINSFGTFSSNGGDGLNITSNSLVNIGSFGGTTEISNNQSSAVRIDRAILQAFGNTHIAGNAQVAIAMVGAGKALLFAFPGVNPSVIENNPKGAVSLQETSEISIGTVLPSLPNVISNNGPFGIEAGFGSQVTLVGVVISGHTGPAVDIYGHSQFYGTSQLQGLGATQIQNNATAGGSLNAAIRVDGNSEALLRGVTVSQNSGPAILALVNSSADFAGSTFSGNTGIITCDSTSTMVSDLSVAGRTPASGVACTTAHTLGNRAVSVPAPAVPDITAWKKMHAAYQQRSAAQK